MTIFISVVVMVSMINIMFANESGVVGNFLKAIHLVSRDTNILGKESAFVPLYVLTGVWQTFGWNSIIFIAVNTYNLIIARTFIQNSIPEDLYEAAVLDGCSHFTYFIKVVLPLSKAVNSVLILYYAVYHWNDYFNALIFNSKSENAPLQIVLREILLLNQAFASGNGGVQGGYGQSSADQVKYAMIIVSTVPILCVYPFIQKYFEKGVMIGAVKG